ncbi:hypothetical protein BIV18_04975 [Peptoniphilus porci]|uniref:Uncharacterized protein n=1 Tax=Peptoniphilus porci TaxID=2652280 RepID=A0A1U7LZT9_9FIRM|nr:hypothetical protein BIV18_04975 [Peptoniphilus porci]
MKSLKKLILSGILLTVLLFLNFFEFYKNEDLVNYECTNIQILGSENNIRTIALNDKGKM